MEREAGKTKRKGRMKEREEGERLTGKEGEKGEKGIREGEREEEEERENVGDPMRGERREDRRG